MQRVKAILLAIGVGVSAGCSESAEPKKVTATPPPAAPVQPAKPLAEVHFIGTDAMKGDTNNGPFLELWALPTSAKLTEHILTRFSEAAPALALGVTNRVEPKLKPLLEKALAREVWFSVPNATSGWTLALNLPQADMTAWTNALAETLTAVGANQPAGVTSGGFKGWEVKSGNLTCSVVPAQDWLVIQSGVSATAGLSNILATIKSAGRPAPALTNGWLQISADLAGIVSGTNVPYASLNWSTRGGLVRTHGTLALAAAMQKPVETWRIPKELIADPLISFTAAQGLGPWVNGWELSRKLGWPQEPNQFFSWAQDGMPFLTTVAVNCPDAAKVMQTFAPKLVDHIQSEVVPEGMMGAQISTNDGRFMWPGFPIIVPFFKDAQTAAGDFLVGGIFPLENPADNPPPPELFEQVEGRTNLYYYDWEVTAFRLPQWQNVYQLFSLMTSELRFNGSSPGQEWITELSPKLGNAITEIALVSSRELSFTRSSHIGFTALEMVNLVEWVDERNFPIASFRFPFQPLGSVIATNTPSGP